MASSADIALHYGLNEAEFFERILGNSMCYTCADWHGTDCLDTAQSQKTDKLLKFMKVDEHTQSLVDLGCGWGGPLSHIGDNYPQISDLRGVTICREQAVYARRYLAEAPCRIFHQDLIDYLAHQPDGSIDVAMMVGVIEHLVTPNDYRAGRHVDRYRFIFETIRRVVKGRFALQTIVAMRDPNSVKGLERRQVLKFQRYISKYVFPNSLTPRDEYIRKAIEGLYEVERFEVRSEEYQQTLQCWRNNLEEIRDCITEERYELFRTYFDLCIEHFGSGYLGLARYALAPR